MWAKLNAQWDFSKDILSMACTMLTKLKTPAHSENLIWTCVESWSKFPNTSYGLQKLDQDTTHIVIKFTTMQVLRAGFFNSVNYSTSGW